MDSDANLVIWQRSAKVWQQVTASPQRPVEEDSRLMLQLASPVLAAHPAADVLVLGVTPEIVQISWPARTTLTALDQSADMIASIWRPNPHVESRVARARWQSMPIQDRSISLVAGDGSLNTLPSLGDFPAVLAEVARVLRPGGGLVLRCFLRPERREPLDAIAAAAFSGCIGSFAALKWRIATALDGGSSFSVAVADIRAEFDRLFPDRGRLARAAGWEAGSLDAIDNYKDVATCFNFPTLAAVRTVMSPVFELAEVRHGHYELAEQCPTLLFRRTA